MPTRSDIWKVNEDDEIPRRISSVSFAPLPTLLSSNCNNNYEEEEEPFSSTTIKSNNNFSISNNHHKLHHYHHPEMTSSRLNSKVSSKTTSSSYRLNPAAASSSSAARRIHHLQTKGFRRDYELGETLRHSSHMVVESNSKKSLRSVESLRKHDFAFVKRSDKSFSYAILAFRSLEPTSSNEKNKKMKKGSMKANHHHSKSNGKSVVVDDDDDDGREEGGEANVDNDDERIGMKITVDDTASNEEQSLEECMTFVMSGTKCVKMLKKDQWSKYIRLTSMEGLDDDDGGDGALVSPTNAVTDKGSRKWNKHQGGKQGATSSSAIGNGGSAIKRKRNVQQQLKLKQQSKEKEKDDELGKKGNKDDEWVPPSIISFIPASREIDDDDDDSYIL